MILRFDDETSNRPEDDVEHHHFAITITSDVFFKIFFELSSVPDYPNEIKDN